MITGRVTIQKAKQDQGTSAVQIARSANARTDQFRVFTVAAGGHLTLDRVRVSNGDVDGNGGGIHNAGTLILQNGSIVTGNTASGSGGGIYNSGTLTLTGASINGNVAGGSGGGVFNAGSTVTIQGGCLAGNQAALGKEMFSSVAVTATNVWWGHGNGPSGLGINSHVTAASPSAVPPANCQSYTCPGLEQTYLVDYNNPTFTSFNQWLKLENPATRHACYSLFERVMAITLFQELGPGAFYYTPNTSNMRQGFIPPNENDISQIAGGTPAQPFATAPVTDSVYYLYSRVALNGIESYAPRNSDPMNYFGTNFNSAMSARWSSRAFCDGNQALKADPKDKEAQGRNFKAFCKKLDYWNGVVSNLITGGERLSAVFTPAYLDYLPFIRQAIHDHAYDVTDPTHDALGARPVNRRWRKYPEQDDPNYQGPKIDGPLESHAAWEFTTLIGKIINYNWQAVGNQAYPVQPDIFTAQKGTIQPNELPVNCTVAESLAEAYMRNLQLIYSRSAFATVQQHQQRNPYYFDINQVRFGISNDQRYSVYTHSLVSGSPNAVIAGKWQTHHFTSKVKPTDPIQGTSARPVSVARGGGLEFVPSQNGSVVAVKTCP